MARERFRSKHALLARFVHDSSGAVAVMTSLLFPVLIGGMALGAEASFWYLSQRKLQQASDLAAYAAAVQLRSGRGVNEMETAAINVAGASGSRAGKDLLKLQHPPGSGSNKADKRAVEVRLERQQIRFFTLIYDAEPVAISARAVAEVRGGGDACLLALDPAASGAITVAGSSVVTFEGCDVATNSNAADAFSMQGGKVELTAGCVHSVGGVDAASGLNLTSCPKAREQAPVVADPYADLDEPVVMGTCESGNIGSNNGSVTVTPTDPHPLGIPSRRYCGGLNPSGTVTFSPGLYIIDGGEFAINAQTKLLGTGVAFFLTNNATIKLNGGGSINLTARESDPLAGVLFYGDRDVLGLEHSINGNAEYQLNGAVYLPSGHLDYRGSFSGSNGCTQIVTGRVTFSGNSSMSVDCSAAGTRRIAVAETIALVE